MREFIIVTKEELTDLINSKILEYNNIYSEEINTIRTNGATVKLSVLFCNKGEHFKSPIKPCGMIKICVSIFPSPYTEKQSMALFLHQKFYSIIGKYTIINQHYYVNWRNPVDIIFHKFVLRYAKKIQKSGAEKALRQKICNVFRSWFFRRRYGNDYLKKYRNVNIISIVIGIIIFILIVLRLLVPRGYHPSLR